MKEAFKTFSFRDSTLDMINRANRIITELRGMGYTLTLRQLYYQLVSRDIIPNKQSEYKRLGSILNDARLAGLVDWDAIEDRTRNLRSNSHWENPDSIIRSAAYSFRINKWEEQPNYVEVWVEKDALVGVLETACVPLDVPYFSCRGYTSQSELYVAGKRIASHIDDGKHPVVIHLGDHDPSGIDMTRDIRERLEMFAGGEVEVRRIALNFDQVEEFNPPPNPAKETDSRFVNYRAIHGDESWELDALDPRTIDNLITREVESLRDGDLWNNAVQKEEKMKAALEKASENWSDVEDFLEDK